MRTRMMTLVFIGVFASLGFVLSSGARKCVYQGAFSTPNHTAAQVIARRHIPIVGTPEPPGKPLPPASPSPRVQGDSLNPNHTATQVIARRHAPIVGAPEPPGQPLPPPPPA